MDSLLKLFVRQRAADLCEYCRLPQLASMAARFHIEHIVACQHGGLSLESNLALACGFCNLHKGPNIASFDPATIQLVPLFNPRQDRWTDHFVWQGTAIIGVTPVGRATIELLAMNHPDRLQMRKDLQDAGQEFAQ